MRPFQFRVALFALAGASLLLGMIMTRAASAAAPTPPKTITARALGPRPHTLRKGTQTVVYVSRDGGRRWHLNSKLGAS